MFTVTKEFKKALKTADRINFTFKENSLTIRFIIEEKKNRSGWIKPEIITEYHANCESYMSFDEAWFNIMYADSSTIYALNYILKAGDVIYFDNMDNSNSYLEKAGLHNDELTCRIYRKDKPIIQRMVLTHSICENNSARSIKAA